MPHTPGPWQWTAGHAGVPDDWGCTTRGVVDPRTHKSDGFVNNLELFGPDLENDVVVSAGGGEYCPIRGKDDEQRVANAYLIAAAPELLDVLKGHLVWLRYVKVRAEQVAIPSSILLGFDQAIKLSERAITKAEGKAQND